MRMSVIVGFLVVAVLAGCTIVNSTAPNQQKTALQLREMQTREFDTNDVRLVMKAMVNVLQDDGFVVKNAVTDQGLLTAVKELQISSKSGNTTSDAEFWGSIFDNLFKSANGNSKSRETKQEVRFDKFKVVEVSVNISEYGKRTKVRANFQAKILDNQGQPSSIYTIEDPKFYQDFFSRVDKGIFLQRQGL